MNEEGRKGRREEGGKEKREEGRRREGKKGFILQAAQTSCILIPRVTVIFQHIPITLTLAVKSSRREDEGKTKPI